MNDNEFEQFAQAVAERIKAMEGDSACGFPQLPPCANLLYSRITVEDFYRSGRTDLDEIVSGQLPLAPGQSVRLRQKAHPGWLAGCFRLTYRLANNGTNHSDIKIQFFVDGVKLDTIMYGSEIYDNANHTVGDGLLPVPLAHGEQCCIGGMNRLEIELTHTGNNNQLEQPRIYVNHGKQACCNACASGKTCQSGCKNDAPVAKPQPRPVPMLGPSPGNQVVFVNK